MDIKKMCDLDIDTILVKYSLALERLETEIRVMIKDYEYNNQVKPVDHIKSRLKSKDSIENKLKSKNLEVNNYNIIKEIHDIIGIRIVCCFIRDVYKIVDLIKNLRIFIIKEEKDYISKPKDTGYISYHLIVLTPLFIDGEEILVEAEVQIRTMAMDFWASIDHKISYKFSEIPKDIKKEMLNCSLIIKSLDEKMSELNEMTEKYRM